MRIALFLVSALIAIKPISRSMCFKRGSFFTLQRSSKPHRYTDNVLVPLGDRHRRMWINPTCSLNGLRLSGTSWEIKTARSLWQNRQIICCSVAECLVLETKWPWVVWLHFEQLVFENDSFFCVYTITKAAFWCHVIFSCPHTDSSYLPQLALYPSQQFMI